MNLQTNTQFKPSLDEEIALQSHYFHTYKLEAELLIKRINKGDQTGEFLADAFISSYRNYELFEHSLGELMKFDLEAIRLFHQILHIRLTKDWDDCLLYDLEQEIIKITGGKS